MSHLHSSKSYNFYTTTELYEYIKFGTPIEEKRTTNYPMRHIQVKTYYAKSGKAIETSFNPIAVLTREDMSPQILELSNEEGLKLFARFNLCRDFVEAFKSIKGII